jgi:hypothetical protein
MEVKNANILITTISFLEWTKREVVEMLEESMFNKEVQTSQIHSLTQ